MNFQISRVKSLLALPQPFLQQSSAPNSNL
uniref:Uncharacterized protein n=1 Tax=Anguilla anguilla TaxID=7936 RepID=A0A0E9UKQ0_ANGAN